MIKKYNNNGSVFLLSYILHLILFVSTITSGAKLCHPDDEKALIKLMKALNNGSVYPSWTNETDCCTNYRFMLKCDLVTHRVYDLYIKNDYTYAGPIPDAVGDFPYLTVLEFHKNPKLTGSIPRAITRLKHLSFLWLSNNNLTGPIPDFIGQLKELTYINLSFNNLTGPIPPSLGFLPKLGALFLDRNQLTGTIPSSFRRITGDQNFNLKLTKNQLSGPIPTSLRAANFSQVYLDRNQFTGDASMFFGKDKGLTNIDLSRNRFSFNMTDLELPSVLHMLDLNHNMIYGSIPPAVAQLGSLNVSYNRLCGQIPSNAGDNPTSFFHNKCLCGSPLPACN